MRRATIILVAIVAAIMCTALFSASSALAYGQCGGEVSSSSGLYQAWQNMGVTNAAGEVLAEGGFHRMDGSLKLFARERIVEAQLDGAQSPTDYGCHPGELFSVGPRLLENRTWIFVILPAVYAKSQVSSHPRKGYRRIPERAFAAGKSNCSNVLSRFVEVFIYVKIKHKPKPRPKPVMCSCEPIKVVPPAPVVPTPVTLVSPPPAGNCNGNNTNNGTGSAGNCNECVGVNVCNTTITPPPEKPCGCEEKKPPPSCPPGEVGTPPHCEKPHCPPDEVGEPPHCHPPTCEETHSCKEPEPVIISVTRINDVRLGETSPNFCVKAEVPGSDTGTLIIAAEYGNFGSSLGSEVTFTVKGIEQQCLTYYPPTEVPMPGEHDKIKVTLRDNNTGLSAPPDEQEFRIDPKPVNPS